MVLYLGLAVLLSLIPTNPEPVSGPRDQQLYIFSNGVHTDFILPVALVPQTLCDQIGYLADYPYLAFGWGDKGFYLDTPTWADLKVSTAVRAMLLPSPTAMHVTGHTGIGEQWARVPLALPQVAILNEFIGSSFRLNERGALIHIDSTGYGDDDEFYEALGSYNALYTCNNWVNEGLKKAGVKTALWAPSEWGVMRWVE